MGIFGDDKLQDERIAALENHIRALTETVQANQVDLAAGWIAILALQAQVDEKVSASDVDSTLGALNEQLGAARGQLEKALTAAGPQHGRSLDMLYELGCISEEEQKLEDARGFYSRILEVDIGYKDVSRKLEALTARE